MAFKMKGMSFYDSPMKQSDAAGTGRVGKLYGKVKSKVKKALKEVFMPVSQQVKRNEQRTIDDLDKSMKSQMTQGERDAYDRAIKKDPSWGPKVDWSKYGKPPLK